MFSNDKPSPVLVLDCGSGSIRAGFAGKDAPKCLVPYNDDGFFYTFRRRSSLSRESDSWSEGLMRDGLVDNWEGMERAWHRTFQELDVDPKDFPILLTEAPHNTPYHREKMTQIMFETFQTPAVCIADQAVLSLYSLGSETGLVFDFSQNTSHVAPVKDHMSVSRAIIQLNWAGVDLTDFLGECLANRISGFSQKRKLDIVSKFKETLCYVAEDFEEEKMSAQSSNSVDKKFTLPDGHELIVGNEQFQVPEAIFQPFLLGLQSLAMHEAIFCSIMRCEERLRRDFFANIVLTGDCTLFPGLDERLRKEVAALAPHKTDVRITAHPKHEISAWTGGSIMASSPLFQERWVSKQKFDERGSSITTEGVFYN